MKKNKLLKFVSSIFAVFAICGLCCFDLLFNKDEYTEVVNAYEYGDDAILLFHTESDANYTIDKEYQGESWTGTMAFELYFDYYLLFNEETGGFTTYFIDFHIDINADIYYLDDHETEYVYNTSSTPYIDDVNIVVGSTLGRETPIFNDGDRITLNITDILSEAGTEPFAKYGFEITNNFMPQTTYTTRKNVFFFEEGSYHPLTSYDYLRYVLSGGYTTHLLDTYINFNSTDTDYSNGYEDGYLAGYQAGFTSSTGNEYAYNQGFEAGQNSMETEVQDAYSLGYSNGYSASDSQDDVVTSIFNGILTVGILPLNFFLSIFNFEILGINLSAFIKALFTVALTLIVLRVVFNGGKD